jgi:hypothetical protein
MAYPFTISMKIQSDQIIAAPNLKYNARINP